MKSKAILKSQLGQGSELYFEIPLEIPFTLDRGLSFVSSSASRTKLSQHNNVLVLMKKSTS